jgi:hypothetical protein
MTFSGWIKSLLIKSSKQDILENSKPKVKKLFVPMWNSFVFIRRLSIGDAKKIKQSVPMNSTEEKSMTMLEDEFQKFTNLSLVYCLLDEEYQQIFTEEQVENFDNDVYNLLALEVLGYNKLNVDINAIREELKKVPTES